MKHSILSSILLTHLILSPLTAHPLTAHLSSLTAHLSPSLTTLALILSPRDLSSLISLSTNS
ncbi:MAG: hypothetical protein MZV63_03405 [Marinilabiliales bacterium]|nr:hypothetical protein [Marinilabiliales bacterium]